MSRTSTIDAFIETIEKYPEAALESAYPAMEQALLFLHGELPEYPAPPAPPDGVSFMNDAQRRWFFAAVKRGAVRGWAYAGGKPVKVGSGRTGNLGRKFTEKVTLEDDQVLGQIGTNVPYAPWVVGPDYPGEDIGGKTMYQARVHQDRWWQFYDVMEASAENAWKKFEEYFWPEFLKRIGGTNS